MASRWARIGPPIQNILVVCFSVYLLLQLLVYLTGWPSSARLSGHALPNHHSQIAVCLILLVFWAVLFSVLQIAKKSDKAFWYYLEHPLYSFIAKVSFILLLAALAALTVIDATCLASQQTGTAAVTPLDIAAVAQGLVHGQSCPAAYGPLVVLATGTLATIGWNYTAFENRHAEIRRFTVQSVEQAIDDPIRQRFRTEIDLAFPDKTVIAPVGSWDELQKSYGDPLHRACVAFFLTGNEPSGLSRDDAEKFNKFRTLYAMGQYCDRLEWLAILVRQRRIDEQLAREMLSGTINNVTNQLQNYIREARSFDLENYEHLVWLREHWSGAASNLHPG